jgi:MraZ protein
MELPPDFKPLTLTDEATIDDKGRILISKKKRERLGEPFAIALGASGCLEAYPEWVWRRKLQDMLQHDTTNLGREQYTRLILGAADDDLRFDAQGRVVVPQKLRELANLKDKVLVVGCGDRLEIWAAAEYAKYMADPQGYGQERRTAIEEAQKRMVGR